MRKQVLIIFVILFFSCDKIIDVPMPDHTPRLVLHGYVATGELFYVTINHTVRANSTLTGEETFVENAWVLLYANDVFVDSLRHDSAAKKYISANITAAAGINYKVVAGANGFTTVEASAKAALPVNAVSVRHEKEVRTNSSGQSMDDILFSFNDTESERNFYITALFPSEYSRAGLVCVYSNDPVVDRLRGAVLPFDDGMCIDHEQILFRDKSFNGKLKEITISAQSESLKTAPDPSGNLHRPYLKRSMISEEHYQYMQATLSLFAGGIIPSIDAPVAITGNVRNGYGLLSVFPVITDSLR